MDPTAAARPKTTSQDRKDDYVARKRRDDPTGEPLVVSWLELVEGMG